MLTIPFQPRDLGLELRLLDRRRDRLLLTAEALGIARCGELRDRRDRAGKLAREPHALMRGIQRRVSRLQPRHQLGLDATPLGLDHFGLRAGDALAQRALAPQRELLLEGQRRHAEAFRQRRAVPPLDVLELQPQHRIRQGALGLDPLERGLGLERLRHQLRAHPPRQGEQPLELRPGHARSGRKVRRLAQRDLVPGRIAGQENEER